MEKIWISYRSNYGREWNRCLRRDFEEKAFGEEL